MHAFLTSLSVEFLILPIEPNGDMETFGEARVLRGLFVHGYFCEM